MKMRLYGRALVGAAATVMGLGVVVEPAAAQWVQVHEQFYFPAEHNWEFRRNYQQADRLFNAFDYGHAILYEKLYNEPNAPVSELEVDEYNFITRKLLVRPPRVPLEEGAIEIAYARIAPEAKAMFEWAHVLHRQAYDVWADESIPLAQKDARMADLLAYYQSRREFAFSAVPKSMDIMDGQPYSLAFRRKYPKFNGLIWGYHWLQIGLYEPLIQGRNLEEREAGVTATVSRFRQMLSNPPETMPYLMPMTAGVAPAFAQRYPEFGAIFDNLHMMHDVISDILVSPLVPRERKGAEIRRMAQLFRDDTSYAITFPEWFQMAQMMGVNNMGGATVGVLASLPQPTVPRGMSMAGMEHGNMAGGTMAGMQHGNMQGGMNMQGAPQGQGMNHGNMNMGGQGQPPMQGMDHSGMGGMQQGQSRAMQGMQGGMDMNRMMEMHQRMMADPVIRERVATDPVLQRMMQEMMQGGKMQGAAGQGMNHGNMQGGMQQGGMNMPMGNMNMGGESASEEDRRQALEFTVRLLSDPQVQARVHSDPELHRLWSDPEVQRRLAEMRRAAPAAAQPAAAPQVPTAPQPATGHNHR